MTRKTYGKTISGRPITDGLIDELVAKAESGYPVEEIVKGRRQPTHRDCQGHGRDDREPTAEMPALSDGQRAERLRRLAKRLHRPDGLDREALNHLERLAGD